MMNVYYRNALVLALLIPEAMVSYRTDFKAPNGLSQRIARLFACHCLFCAVVFVSLLPTFLTRYFVYGGFFETGYVPIEAWEWRSPWFLAVVFSANHGLFSWTPLLLIATGGLFLFWRRFPAIGISVICVLLVFYYFMAAYPDWAGISSYGNRFFVSLTVFFVLGLAPVLQAIASRLRSRAAASAGLAAALGLFRRWNLGLLFHWESHLFL